MIVIVVDLDHPDNSEIFNLQVSIIDLSRTTESDTSRVNQTEESRFRRSEGL